MASKLEKAQAQYEKLLIELGNKAQMVDMLGKADLKGFVGTDHVTGEDQFLCLAGAYQPCKSLGSTEAGNDSEAYFWLSEFCSL